MEAFVAYRLPNSKDIIHVKGIANSYNSISELKTKKGFVFNSFNGDKNYLISELININPNNFKIFYGLTHPKTITESSYLNICASLIQNLKDKKFSKVILSRVEKVNTKHNALDIFNKLNNLYSNTFNYVISIKNVGCWIGATPEKLVNIDNNTVSTVSIAGTKQTNENWGLKEIEEQQLVTDFIYKTLKKITTQLIKGETTTIKAGNVEHLKTEFTATLKSDWNLVVDALHPTPATCGLPKIEAQQHINNIEPHNREFYTGYLGLINNQEKHLFVNLRCLQLFNESAFLYLGGGITAKSNAKKEWAETIKKSKTLLSVL